MKTLGPLSNGCYVDIGRFDLLDVTETEIKQLTDAAHRATCASDLDAVAGFRRSASSRWARHGHGDLRGARASRRDRATAARAQSARPY